MACTLTGLQSAVAQIDYRNLDDHRPVRTEDAYPIERYAFELLLPYVYENGPGGEQVHLFTPELGYGVLANTQVGLKLPLAVLDQPTDTDWGFAGPRLFGLYNLNTEGRRAPGLALRADLALPLGNLAGDDPQLTIKAIATRSWGRTRLHLNGALTVGNPTRRPVAEAEPSWALSIAGDLTLLRQSLLLVGELGALEAGSGQPTQGTAALGFRSQLTPTLVLDAGVSRRLLTDTGPDLGLTLGFSHAFALAGLMRVSRR
jgi:hypothetical protein